MTSRNQTISWNTIYLVAALLLGPLIGHTSARGRSFPIEVTGTVINVDRSKVEFTIQVDEPASILRIAVGRDCKFKQNRTPASDQILRKGAHLRVSYFSTIFTGKIAVEIELNPVPKVKHRRFLSSVEQRDTQVVNPIPVNDRK